MEHTANRQPLKANGQLMFEFFEHTADVGIRARAPDLGGLFAEAGRALSSLIVEDLKAVRLDAQFTFELEAVSVEDLLFDWLSELLYAFAVRKTALREFRVDVTRTGGTARLRAVAEGERFDLRRHGASHEVKAVTYHGLSVRREQGGDWLAEVILDI
jgi:SHS2 domain-containing protein